MFESRRFRRGAYIMGRSGVDVGHRSLGANAAPGRKAEGSASRKTKRPPGRNAEGPSDDAGGPTADDNAGDPTADDSHNAAGGDAVPTQTRKEQALLPEAQHRCQADDQSAGGRGTQPEPSADFLLQVDAG